MLYCVPEALKNQSGTAFVSMMVTKQASIFSSISPVTRTADTYHTSSLLEMSLLQWPIPMTWQAMVHRRQEHHFSSMLLDKCKITSVRGDGRLFHLPSQVNQTSKDSSSDAVRRTDTSSYERKAASTWPGDPVLVKNHHNAHNLWKQPKTALIWEQSILFDGISPFILSSVVSVWMGWESPLGNRKGQWEAGDTATGLWPCEKCHANTCHQMRSRGDA